MDRRELQRDVDYLYCAECERHVPSVRLEEGVWEVQCPRCVGECGLCACSETGYCRVPGQGLSPTHVFVARSGKK